jgi:hypothetical protein
MERIMIYKDRLSGREFKVEIMEEKGQHYKVSGLGSEPRLVHKGDVRSETEAVWRVVAFMASERGGYHVRKSQFGSYQCECKGFQYYKKCKHIDSYLGLGVSWKAWRP